MCCETSGPLGILTLANPPLNLFSAEVIEDLRAAVTEIRRAPIRALLVQAEGNIFSSGADVCVFQGIVKLMDHGLTVPQYIVIMTSFERPIVY